MSVISIGGQDGGSGRRDIQKIKVDLYKALNASCTSTYCEAVDEYAPVLRIDGSSSQFGEEGITRLRFAKKRRYITADIQIPESVWEPLNSNEMRNYLATQVRSSIELFVERLKQDKFEVKDSALFAEIDDGIANFLTINYGANQAG